MKINWQKKRWLAILPVIGILGLVLVATNKRPPQKKQEQALPPLVSVTQVTRSKLSPYVTGFGRVRPKESWQALSEVSGRVIYRHPDLEQGKALKAGTLILKIDPVDYELKLAQAKSDLNSARAELSRTRFNEDKLALSLKLEKQRLAILNKELERKKGLLNSNAISRSTVDIEQSNVWSQEQKVLDLENSVKQHPANMAVAEAKVRLAEARLSEAERKLAKTGIVLPFDARIAEVNAELEQVVSERDKLVQAHRTDVMEIPVQVAMTDMRHFARYMAKPVSAEQGFPDIQSWQLAAEVSLYVGKQQFIWPGKLTSVGESIDPKGNTVTLIVDVALADEPFEPGKRPPLNNDMYVQARVLAEPRPLLSVPSEALHGDRLYLLNEKGELEIRSVEIGFESKGQTVISAGLKEGETLVLSDVSPAIPGRPLRAAKQNSAPQEGGL